MDYREYYCNAAEICGCILAGTAASALISWLVYRSWHAMISVPLLVFLFVRIYKREQIQKRKEQLLLEFKDGMQAVSAALVAGYSMEHAWREAEKEVREMYGKKSLIYIEMHQMNVSVQMNEPLEKALSEFAERSGCEEIENFGEVFSFAKRGGGNFPEIIRTTVQRLSAKIEVEHEIATVISGKKLEGRIMGIMPVLILAYLNMISGSFLQALYGNLSGVLIMSTALAVYAGAQKLSSHILDIEV